MPKLISELNKGAWSAVINYKLGDIVSSGGSSYICVLNGMNHVPPNATYWALLASKGDVGATGPTGPQGVRGLTGFGGADLDTDVTLAANSDVKVATQKAVKTYVDTQANSNRQVLINGNFDIWQRAVTLANPGSTQLAADRWVISYTNTGTLPVTLTHSRQALTPGDIANAFYFYRLATTGAGAGFGNSNFYLLRQAIENGTRLLAGAGKSITVSFYAKSSIVGKKLGVGCEQEYGTGGSPSAPDIATGSVITLTASWVKYTVTFNLATLVGKTFGTNNDDVVVLFLFNMWGSTIGTNFLAGAAAETFVGAGNIDIAQVQVCGGVTAIPFQAKSFDEELQACQRYFCKSYDYTSLPGDSVSAGVIQGVGISQLGRPVLSYTFPRRMRIVPTMTFYSTTGVAGKLRDATAGGDYPATSLYPGQTGGSVYDPASTVGMGNHVLAHWTAECEL